jgi:phosphoserine phosphatase RsbU/P
MTDGNSLMLPFRTLSLLVLVFAPAAVPSQSIALSNAPVFDATNLRIPAELGATGVAFAGDDPAFAQPDFDDSKWLPIDDKRPVRVIFPQPGPMVIWQRMHIKVAPENTGLALRAVGIAPEFELYVNGQKLLTSGRFHPAIAYTMEAQQVIRIPDASVATGTLVIAIRESTEPEWWLPVSDARFFAGMLLLGQETSLSDHVWMRVIGKNAFEWCQQIVGIGVGLVALALFLNQRRQKEYLWFAVSELVQLIQLPIVVAHTLTNVPVAFYYVDPLLTAVANFFLALMVFAFLQRKFSGVIRVYVMLSFVTNILDGWMIHRGLSSLAYVRTVYTLEILASGVFAIVIPAMLISHRRHGNREASILIVPMGLVCLLRLWTDAILLLALNPAWWPQVRALSEGSSFTTGPFTQGFDSVIQLIIYVSIALILVLRSTRVSRQQSILEGELEAARQVQQVILPEQIEAITGFSTESVYQPAQQVGGDFFQILPASQSGLLLVLGDVAGKGLPAAMMVSLLVGAIRTAAEDTHDPAALLATLNERLVGRTRGGFSTALAAHIAAEGTVTIANAGHLSPYLDGTEIDLPGALPLGIVSGAVYETKQFQLAIGSRLTFYSDGVIEAQNGKGELFGFERGQAISTRPAIEIAEAAKQFGQSDDITVVTIARGPAVGDDILVCSSGDHS